MPKVSEKYMQVRKEQILDAASNCFARKGFHQTSMKDICEESRLSPGSVYLHFNSKEDIIEASWKRAEEIRTARFEEVKQKETPLQAFNTTRENFSKRLAQPAPDKAWQLWVQLLSESLRDPHIRKNICRKWDETAKQLADLFQQSTESGEFECKIDCDVAARVYLAMHDGLVLQKIIDPKQDVPKYLEAFNILLNQSKNK
jgi:AcrR family transcriptional regulator